MTSEVELTDRQRKILDLIRWHIEEHGAPPTIREIGAFLGIRSTNGVNDHLLALEKKGMLRRRRQNRARAIVLTDAAGQVSGWCRVRDVSEVVIAVFNEYRDRGFKSPHPAVDDAEAFALDVEAAINKRRGKT